jgi:hypothetical protein
MLLLLLGLLLLGKWLLKHPNRHQVKLVSLKIQIFVHVSVSLDHFLEGEVHEDILVAVCIVVLQQGAEAFNLHLVFLNIVQIGNHLVWL